MADAAPTDREIFDELVELPLAERDRALERLAVEPARRVRIARLLLAEGKVSRTTGFLDRAFVAAIADAGSVPFQPEHLPKRLGHFTLLREIGSGGMGIVYEAEQDYPKRRVALKVMRSDLGTRELTQRFRREIETLGRLQHPGIAQIHEAGTISEGEWARAPIPYIAMQLVTGTALDDWCARERPGPRRIAELIASTCDAIQHAHQRGVVHRDLKPANILVVRDPDSSGSSPPRTIVLDFGIARLIEADGPRGVHPTLATSAGQILGTIAYMSPEQLGGDPSAIDIRTDVYALGVILYELLSGRSPLDVRDRPLADAARIVRDEEPTRLGAINPSLRGDLETIVAKAIEKEPARRYPAASALGEELRRHLRDEPILAKPTTRIERLRRFTRRHRAVVGGAVATFLALASGTVVTSIFAAKAVSQRDAAEWQAYRANIAAASAALSGHDVETARRYLDATAVRFRGWEWRYLHASLDRSLARVDLPDSPYLSSPQLQACPSVWPALAKHRGADEQGGDSPAPRLGAPRLEAPRLGAPPDADGVAQLQVANADGTREVWTLPPTLTKAARVSMRIGGPTAELSTIELNEHPNANIQSIALSTDASALVAVLSLPSDAAHRPASLLWHCSLATGQRRTIEIGNSGRHFALAAGPGPLVGAGGGPNRLPCIWNAETGTVLDLLGHIGDINAI
ncbi:MAG: serine/threonine protein kinase, partial [Phycisphaerae bacterium]|nr:serine/threonine protein kinase [Phycisphaerae bacterium]